VAQLTDDCFAFGGELMSLDEAVALAGARVRAVEGALAVPLLDADGRVLAEDVTAPRDLPPFDNSAVDGYAVSHADLAPGSETRLPVRGRIIAGVALGRAIGAREAVRVFTGAPMPDGADTVFMQEDVRVEGGGVMLPPGLKPGANRRLAGEDVASGMRLLPAGRVLRPQDLALAAASGLDRLTVRRRLTAAVFSTGNELIEAGSTLGPAAIYDSNRVLLGAMLRRLGILVADLGILPDDPAIIRRALRDAAREHDLVLTSGGVSTGEEDHVRAAVEAEGRLHFWRIGIKPGRPVAMGVVEGTPFVGLPGNPVAVFVTFGAIVRPLVAALSGASYEPPLPVPVASGFRYAKKAGRREYVRVRIEQREGGAVALKHPQDGASVLASLTETHGLVELLEDALAVTPGDTLRFLPYAALT